MITKEQFLDLINGYIKYDAGISNIEKSMCVDISSSELVSYAYKLFDKVIAMLFNEIGTENVYWWLYEKREDPKLTMKDEKGNIIPTETFDDIWEIVKEDRV